MATQTITNQDLDQSEINRIIRDFEKTFKEFECDVKVTKLSRNRFKIICDGQKVFVSFHRDGALKKISFKETTLEWFQGAIMTLTTKTFVRVSLRGIFKLKEEPLQLPPDLRFCGFCGAKEKAVILKSPGGMIVSLGFPDREETGLDPNEYII